MPRKYMDIYNAIRADIYAKYPAGSFLPTEKELMEQYNASRTTIRHAISMLRDEKLLDIRQGAGTRVVMHNHGSFTHTIPLFHNVTDITDRILLEDDQQISVHGCIVDMIPAPSEVARQLQVTEGTIVYRIERIMSVQNVPFAFFKNFLRCDLVPNLDKYSGKEEKLHNLYKFIEEEYGVRFENGVESISAQLSSFFDSKLLGIKPGLPLIMLRRTAYTAGQKTFEYCERLLRPDIISIVVTMNGSPKYDT